MNLAKALLVAAMLTANLLTACLSNASASDWYPLRVQVWDQPFVRESTRKEVDYIPLQKAEKKWKICVSFPHVKDSFWLAVDYGVAEESERLGIEMELFEAGGFNNLDIQIQQIRDCVANKADGVVIGAISTDGLNPLVAELKKQNIPVIDLVNGISSPDITAKSSYSHKDMGYMVGDFIARSQKEAGNTEPVNVAWLPGPKGAGWVDYSNEGFEVAVKENPDINVLTVKYGDTGKRVQRKLLKEVLAEDLALDYIAGTAVTAEVAISMLRKKKLDKKVKLVTQYFNPGVYAGIKRGKIAAAVSLSSVIQGRIAIDQIVRILEGKQYYKHVGVKLNVVHSGNLRTFDRASTLAPNGFRTVYSVN
ncbi:TMAO reductase system periplasmic protein TorT [Thalassomonas sp. RHCl1]|uniref:TMAO reductase system periplasmic protein TorT n=1 Tax=Thalassomonas sp. RHCl1 TaxID=2995320 RepID=UPI00248B821A|nr:TMAO reductase system periplasmic protein TorT [Thalassomonas sp. RHCl1]